MTRDYYAVLGVATAASSAQIRRAYQRLARQYSPDVNLWQQEVVGVFAEIAELLGNSPDAARRGVLGRLLSPAVDDATQARGLRCVTPA